MSLPILQKRLQWNWEKSITHGRVVVPLCYIGKNKALHVMSNSTVLILIKLWGSCQKSCRFLCWFLATCDLDCTCQEGSALRSI